MLKTGTSARPGPSRHAASSTVLSIRDLHVYYGQSHALQGVDLALEEGVLSVVGRNGMGKTTLCNSIMGLLQPRRGSIKFYGQDISGKQPNQVASMGIAYTPQGRRLWPSLTVDEHLRLSESQGAWTVDRIYDTFPRLFERRTNGAGQLSGGEQQMLAISRALLQNPTLLVLDEPTEGLAPVIVDHVQDLIVSLVAEREVAILLIEQNISVATSVSEDVAIMVNGRISRTLPSQQLASDRALQERLLGVGRHSHDEEPVDVPSFEAPQVVEEATEVKEAKVKETELSEEEAAVQPETPEPLHKTYIPPTRWSPAAWKEETSAPVSQVTADASKNKAQNGDPGDVIRPFDQKPEPIFAEPLAPVAAFGGNEVYVVGTFDTKGDELRFVRDRIIDQGVRVKTVDLSTSQAPSSADVPPHMIAAYSPGGAGAVFSGDRGASVAAMAKAFENWLPRQHGIGGVISAGGSGGTALVAPAMRRLPVGVPKLIISTVASGDVGQYVGPADIMMMYSVTDVQGLNQISRRVLSNGASAIAGMVSSKPARATRRAPVADKPGLGLSMFGVTTTAVQSITKLLEHDYDCLVFHATGTGGRSMEKLADSGLLEAAIDLTTTEVCDMMMGGVFSADEDRFGAFIRSRIPYVGSCGALDMVNFGAPSTIPQKYKNRTFVEHNPQVTLMRTTVEENARMGDWIASRLNLMSGPVRFLIPEGGVSALDAPGQAFHDPEANTALFNAISQRFEETTTRRLIRVPHHINDPAFATAAVSTLLEINPIKRTQNYATV